MVICLERGADLYMAQLMPLPLTVSCFTKIQIGFTVPFWYRLTQVVLEKGPLNRCMYVCNYQVIEFAVRPVIADVKRNNVSIISSVSVGV